MADLDAGDRDQERAGGLHRSHAGHRQGRAAVSFATGWRAAKSVAAMLLPVSCVASDYTDIWQDAQNARVIVFGLALVICVCAIFALADNQDQGPQR